VALLGGGAGLAFKGCGGLEHERQHGGYLGSGCVVSPALGSDNHPLRQSSQFGSDEFSCVCKENCLSTSMSRRGNCWANAVAKSIFTKLKNKKIKKMVYKTRQEA